jgi:Protein of unknown function (DUF732)
VSAVEHPREFDSASTDFDRILLTGLARKKIQDVESRNWSLRTSRGGSHLHTLVNALLNYEEPPFRAFAILHICAASDPLLAALLTPGRKEGNRMPSPRWLARLTIPMMAGAALVSSAAIATANPADDAYLAQLRAIGLTWPPSTEEALIGEAHLICYDLTWGWTPQQIADDLHADLNKRGVTLLDVGTLVNAAHSTYCPGNVCDAPTLCT